MSLPWFRFYHEVKDDPKMGGLTDLEFRVFVEGMCWACEVCDAGSTGQTMETANWAFRRNVTETLQSLLQKQMLTLRGDGKICITNWMKRQIPSDSSTARVRKYREKRSETLHETLQSRPCNVRDLEERRGEHIIKEGARAREADFSEIPTEDEAVLSTMCAGIPQEFSRYIYGDWATRGGRDGAGILVPFARLAAKRWAREQNDWKAKTHKGNKPPVGANGKPFLDPHRAIGNDPL